MAVLQMQRISICALRKDRKKILECLQRQGVVEIEDRIAEDDVFKKIETTSFEIQFERSAGETKTALEILDEYAPEKKSMLSGLEGRKPVLCGEYDIFYKKYDEVARIVKTLLTLGKGIAESKAEALKLELQIEALTPWKTLDIPLNFVGTKSTSAFIGTLPNEWNLEMIYEELSEFTPINVNVISVSREQTCVFIICQKANENQLSEKLKTMGFAYPAVSADVAPLEQIKIFEEQIAKYKTDVEDFAKEIKDLSVRREDVEFFFDYQTMRVEKYNVMGRVMHTEHTFVLTGYIATKDIENVKYYLKDYDIAIETQDTTDEDDVPVLLKNNAFNSPLEGVVESYSLPGKGEIDPTSISAIFYYIFFGAMLSEGAYGLILAIATGVLLKKYKNMEESTRKFLTMFFFCGISTIIWGIIYGSFFGDVITVVSTTFFGKTVSLKPLWLDPIANPMSVLVMVMCLGIIHIYVGLAANFYQCIRSKDYKSAIYDVIFWYIILTACIVLALSSQMIIDMLGLEFILPKMAGTISLYVVLASAIGIILTGGRESKNPGKRILKGLYGLYNITGYLSDVLSYSRLLALGLATGVICNVVNQIGSMGGPGVGGVITFILVFIAGNALNIGINTLGAYVHSNRLTYVELFGKFYDGGGRKFEAYSAKTNYYKIKEK